MTAERPVGVARFEPFVLATIIAMAAALRFGLLGWHSVSLDEALSIEDSRDLSATLAGGFHPPLYYLLLRGWSLLLGSDVGTARALSAVAGVLTVVAGHRAFLAYVPRRGVALVVATLIALMPIDLWFSRELRMYSLWTLLAVCYAWALAGAGARQLTRARVAAIWGSAVAAVMTHHYSVFFLLAGACAAYALCGEPLRSEAGVSETRTTRARVARVAWLSVPAIAMSLASAVVIVVGTNLQQIGDFLVDTHDESLPVSLARTVLFRNWAYELQGGEAMRAGLLVLLALGVGTVALLADGAASPARRRALALLTWVPLLIIALAPIRNYTRLFAASAPFIACVLAMACCAPAVFAGARAGPGGKRRRAGVALSAACLVGTALGLWPAIVDVYARELEPWNDVCSRIEGEEQDGDVIVIVASYMKKPFQLCYSGTSKIIVFASDRKQGIAPEQLTEAVRGSTGVWLVLSHDRKADEDGGVARTIAGTHHLVEAWQPGALIRVLRFRVPA